MLSLSSRVHSSFLLGLTSFAVTSLGLKFEHLVCRWNQGRGLLLSAQRLPDLGESPALPLGPDACWGRRHKGLGQGEGDL